MPTYEYACKDCGEHLEVVQSFKDDPLTECPNCEGELRKVFSAAGIIFKGSGWHVKDYARTTCRWVTSSSPLICDLLGGHAIWHPTAPSPAATRSRSPASS
jgi:putative FmdB family regulatory protein